MWMPGIKVYYIKKSLTIIGCEISSVYESREQIIDLKVIVTDCEIRCTQIILIEIKTFD